VGMGSKLISEKLIAEQNFSELTVATKNALNIIKSIR